MKLLEIKRLSAAPTSKWEAVFTPQVACYFAVCEPAKESETLDQIKNLLDDIPVTHRTLSRKNMLRGERLHDPERLVVYNSQGNPRLKISYK